RTDIERAGGRRDAFRRGHVRSRSRHRLKAIQALGAVSLHLVAVSNRLRASIALVARSPLRSDHPRLLFHGDGRPVSFHGALLAFGPLCRKSVEFERSITCLAVA